MNDLPMQRITGLSLTPPDQEVIDAHEEEWERSRALLVHAFEGDRCPECDGLFAAVSEALRTTGHIKDRDLRARYIGTDLRLRGWTLLPTDKVDALLRPDARQSEKVTP